MSLTMLEKVLYDLTVERAAKQAFRDDPGALLARYRLNGDEVELIRAFDLHELAARGVNPMLLMGFWQLSGEGMRSYLGRIATPSSRPTSGPDPSSQPSDGPDSSAQEN